jgi:predicted TPR repeat methyltransferase
MKNQTPLNLAAVQELHQTGMYEEAKEGYLQLLKKTPHDSELLYALGILSAQLSDFQAAVDYFRQAIQYSPDNPVLYLNLGNALKTLGDYGEAISILEKAIALKPDYSAALNNLGTVYYTLNSQDIAVQYYEQALQIKPDYVDAKYNLGLALVKLQKLEEAKKIYEAILAVSPTHAAAHFQLGCLLLAQEKITAAESHFLLLEENYPHHFETQTNLATCYLREGALGQARIHYQKALALMPQDTQVLFNLGVICMQLGDADAAIQYYQRALQANPDYFDAHNNIGVAFLMKQHPAFALQHFKEAQRLQPDNEAINYTVQVLSQDQRLLASPSGYIKNLFDTYADHYEIHLLQGLSYQVPQQLFDAVKAAVKSDRKLDILDIGCGTGLCGVIFKPLAKTLVGVDLSPKMLEVAAEKNIYDELVADEIVDYLNSKPQSCDLIISGDVFVYIGDLNPVLTAAHAALRAKGLLVFNTEMTEQDDYTMNQSGRFSHHKKYLQQIAQTLGFKMINYQSVVTRQQQDNPVYGHLCVLQKSSS